MATPSTAPHPPLSREAQARRDLGHTHVSPGVARVLVTVFLATLLVMGLVEVARVVWTREPGVWLHLARIPATAATEGRTSQGGAWTRVVAANRATLSSLDAFESGLEQESVVGRALRPPSQLLLSGWLGAGNERVYVGREGWLFYRPDVEYATGRPFLDEDQQARRVAAAAEWESRPAVDPVAAMAQLKLDLDRRGITLLVVPTPVKPTIHPAELAAAYEGFDAPVQNPSFTALVAALGREGILVYDPAPRLVQRRAGGEPQYLQTDTHWRPAALQYVATEVAGFLAARAGITRGSHRYTQSVAHVRQAGDTAQMLDLPPSQQTFPPEAVEVTSVSEADGTPWRPTRGAEVLLLGDSFSNIYALESMGWGSGAGFAEHLSVALGRPVDRLVQNDQGAWATRAMLQQVSHADPERLANTRLVVYQFAARELAQGDWRLLPLAPP